MDLFRYAEKSNNPKLKKLAKHELNELGGEKVAEAHEKKVKVAKKMQSKEYTTTRCGHCGKFGHHHSAHRTAETIIDRQVERFGPRNPEKEREHEEARRRSKM